MDTIDIIGFLRSILLFLVPGAMDEETVVNGDRGRSKFKASQSTDEVVIVEEPNLQSKKSTTSTVTAKRQSVYKRSQSLNAKMYANAKTSGSFADIALANYHSCKFTLLIKVVPFFCARERKPFFQSEEKTQIFSINQLPLSVPSVKKKSLLCSKSNKSGSFLKNALAERKVSFILREYGHFQL